VEQNTAHFLHDIVPGVKTQVNAQYDPDSPAMEVTRSGNRKGT